MKKKNFGRKTTFLIGVCTGIGFCLLALGVNSGIFWQESGKEPNVVFDAPASFAPIAEKLSPAVVTVYTTRLTGLQFGPGKFFFTPGPRMEKGSGSGFIITSDGYIITSVQDFNQVVKKLKPGQMLRIYYRRGYSSMFWAFRLPQK